MDNPKSQNEWRSSDTFRRTSSPSAVVEATLDPPSCYRSKITAGALLVALAMAATDGIEITLS
jgi:hypothetical protein